MLPATLLATLYLCLCLLLSFPVPSTAQPPVEHSPDGYFHGWQCEDFVTSRNPTTPHLVYLLDVGRHVIALDSRDGRVVHNRTYWTLELNLIAIATDSRGYVFVTSTNFAAESDLLVLDEQLHPLRNVSLNDLRPRSVFPAFLQLAVDSGDTVYLFDSSPRSATDGRVWSLSPREWRQQATWQAPVERTAVNGTEALYYVMAIDSQDALYFQQISSYRTLFITDQRGELQYSQRLANSTGGPDISDVAIDADGHMWHTYDASTYVTVIDTDGNVLAAHNVLSVDRPTSKPLDIDQRGRVIVSDEAEGALLVLSPATGDIVSTLEPDVLSMWLATDLYADRTGRGGASLLISPGPDFVAQRMSIDDRDAGRLLQRYTLPARLSGICVFQDMDVSAASGALYMLLLCDDNNAAFALIYVVAQSGRVLSEFRLSLDAYRVRVDERAAMLYLVCAPPGIGASWVTAVSTTDGMQVANYTINSPGLGFVDDMLVLPPGPQSGSSTLVLVDLQNRRFVRLDTGGTSAPVLQPFADNTICWRIAYTIDPQAASYYASCARTERVNGTSESSVFVHKWDVTDPSSPRLTDSFVAPAGIDAYFGPLVVGYGGHLYAIDFNHGSLWQWWDADRSTAGSQQQQQDERPRAHVGRVTGEAEQTREGLAANMAQSAVLSKQWRMRGAS